MDRRCSSHIIPEIYETTIDPSHWDYVVTMIAKLTRSKLACLYYKNKDIDIVSTIAQFGLPESDRMNFNDQCDILDDMFCSKQSFAVNKSALQEIHFAPSFIQAATAS